METNEIYIDNLNCVQSKELRRGKVRNSLATVNWKKNEKENTGRIQ